MYSSVPSIANTRIHKDKMFAFPFIGHKQLLYRAGVSVSVTTELDKLLAQKKVQAENYVEKVIDPKC